MQRQMLKAGTGDKGTRDRKKEGESADWKRKK